MSSSSDSETNSDFLTKYRLWCDICTYGIEDNDIFYINRTTLLSHKIDTFDICEECWKTNDEKFELNLDNAFAYKFLGGNFIGNILKTEANKQGLFHSTGTDWGKIGFRNMFVKGECDKVPE